MLRCDNCGALFEAPIAASRDSSDGLPYCPHCGAGGEYGEVDTCDYCGEYDEHVTTLSCGDRVCEKCYDEMRSEINETFAEFIKDTATEYGIDIDDVKEMLDF